MSTLCKAWIWLLILGLLGFSRVGIIAAQDPLQTPSQKTKEAVEKFHKAPATIGKSLEALTDAAKDKLQRAMGAKRPGDTKSGGDELTLPPKKAGQPAGPHFSSEGKRDPFRPYNLRTKTTARPKENLSPLERFELSQLKLVGIIWDIKEPRALIEDTGGLGYIITVGTPIGSNEGKVKAIHRNEVVVMEYYEDFYGKKKPREVSLKLSVD